MKRKELNKDLVEFPMRLKFDEPCKKIEFFNSENTIDVDMLSAPNDGFRYLSALKVMSTWSDSPLDKIQNMDEDDINDIFMQVLSGKVLPNSMESLVFDFRVSGITLIEITHILRHRVLFGIHAQCTADRFLNDDSSFIPSSIENSEFNEEYKRITQEARELYVKMNNSRDISIMDSRYILPRNCRYFYYFSINLKEAIGFIKQRRCTAIQPELDNIIAAKMYANILTIIPELKEVLSLQCDRGCHTTFNNDKHTTRLYQPDENHEAIMNAKKCTIIDDRNNFVYNKKREMFNTYYDKSDIKYLPKKALKC